MFMARWENIAAILVAGLLLGGCAPRATGDPAAALARGWELYRAGEYNQALAAFEHVANQAAPTSTLQLAAWYGIASTWNLRRPDENPARARQWYRRIIAAAPTNDYAAWSLLALARMQHLAGTSSNGVDAAVLRAYQDVCDAFPGHPAADEAFLHQQACKVATFDTNVVRQALHAISTHLQRSSTTSLASALYDLQSYAFRLCDEPARQLAMEIAACEARELDPANPYVDNSYQYWHIATTAEFLAGDFATARRYYRRFIKEYPNDQRRYGARQALKRMAAFEARLQREVDVATEQRQ
jgi:tetratricopeptide (TPR) repeat protein